LPLGILGSLGVLERFCGQGTGAWKTEKLLTKRDPAAAWQAGLRLLSFGPADDKEFCRNLPSEAQETSEFCRQKRVSRQKAQRSQTKAATGGRAALYSERGNDLGNSLTQRRKGKAQARIVFARESRE